LIFMDTIWKLMMKAFLKIFFKVILICCIFVSVEAGEVLKIAVDDDFPPFSFLKNGEAAGIDVDIAKELGKRLGIDFEISLMPWKRLLTMTKNGSFDGSMSLFKTREREKYAIFTHPVHYSKFVLFVKKGNEFEYNSIKDLYGKVILQEAGFSIGDEFDQAVREKKIIVYEVFVSKNIFRLIVNKSYDAFVNNLDVILYKLENQKDFMKYADEISYLPKPVKAKGAAYLVLSKNARLKNKKALAKKITKNLMDMETDGTYSKIASEYIKNIEYQ
jgi:polar amino acid transport system substrate-binding protein